METNYLDKKDFTNNLAIRICGDTPFSMINEEELTLFKEQSETILMMPTKDKYNNKIKYHYYIQLQTYLTAFLPIKFSKTEYYEFKNKKYIILTCQAYSLDQTEIASLSKFFKYYTIEAVRGYTEEKGETFSLEIKVPIK